MLRAKHDYSGISRLNHNYLGIKWVFKHKDLQNFDKKLNRYEYFFKGFIMKQFMEIVQQYMGYLMCHILPLQLIVDGGCNGKLGFERFNWAEIVMCYTSFIGIFNNCMSCYFQVTPPRSASLWNVRYQTTTIQILYIKTSQNLMSRFSTNVQLPGVMKQGIVLPVTPQSQLQMSRSEWRRMRDEYFWADGLVSLTGHLTAKWSVYRDLKSSRQVDMHMIQLVLSWC